MHECSGTECQSLEKKFHISTKTDSSVCVNANFVQGCDISITDSVEEEPHHLFLPDMSAGPEYTLLFVEHSHGTPPKKAITSSWPEISIQYKMLFHNTCFKACRKHSHFTCCAELFCRKQGCKRNYVNTEHILPVAKLMLWTSLAHKPKFVFNSLESIKGTFCSFQIHLWPQSFTELKWQWFCDSNVGGTVFVQGGTSWRGYCLKRTISAHV